ncbi:right-handed parallel beta-helix repeat-containing protein [Flavobacterium sp. GSB-24]|uniref:right-handed parallel beta-helix repeat-containing protein n=1 Tax=Flavobacterium sp. GSB-24 TaxID=2994319 RepID=UPI00248F6D26|nr:right-handed parallel beta-helix repeat-containing protein [Flavobacterium sp. GSB-24]BDU25772.1 hypothetical protein FLGSB24_25160 [Flavobacterium sp. GSB-24]
MKKKTIFQTLLFTILLAYSCSDNNDPVKDETTTVNTEVQTPITGKTYYVDASVTASGNGLTEATAFKTLSEAAAVTAPGDGVLVKNGTYSNFEEKTSGTPTAWVVWRNFPGHKPKITYTSWVGIYIKGSYIEIDGFTVQGNNDNITLTDALNQPGGCKVTGAPQSIYNGNGILADSRTSAFNNPLGEFYHHINIKNCIVYDCGGAGVAAINCDYIKIENCTIYDNAWYSIYGTSGISLLELKNFNTDTDANRNIIRNNILYNNKMLVPWRDGGCKFTDGNGIIIDYANVNDYSGKTLIENNVVYNNGGRGIHVYNSSNVNIVNNTCYQNCSTPEISEGEITIIGKSATIKSKNCSVYNNILYARTGEKVNTVANAENYSQRNNIYFNSTLGDDLPTLGSTVNPMFVNAEAGDFKLKENSKAIDFGYIKKYYPAFDILGNARYKGASIDCGAYEIK